MKKFLSIIIVTFLCVCPVYALPSDGVIYDGSTSGSSATNVNDALNDLYSKLKEKQDELDRINNIGNAASNHILNGYTAYVKGKTVTGSIPSKGAITYTPGVSNQTIASGQYISGIQTIKGDANLVAGNIAKGKSIFGINGTYTSDANAVAGNILSGKTAYVNGSKITGSMPNRSNDTGTTGLSWPTNNYQLVGSQLRIGINAGYYGSNNYSNWGTPGIAIENIASKIGLTADKLVSGTTVAGITGTGGGDSKVYKFNKVQASVSSGVTLKHGTWVSLAKKGETNSYSINLGFTPKEVVTCDVKMTGNYVSSSDSSWSANFRMSRGYGINSSSVQYSYMSSLPSGFYMSTTNNVNSYSDTKTECVVSGSTLSFKIISYTDGTGGGWPIQTCADALYLSGTLVYK